MKYYTATAAILFSFYNLLLLSLFNTFSTLLLLRFHLTTTQYGLFAGCDLLANALGLLLIGPLLDKYGSRKMGLTFITVAIVSCLVIAESNSLALDIIARFCQGLASAASLLICLRTAITYFEKKASLAVSTMIAFALTGGLVGNSVFAIIGKNFGLDSSFYIAAIIGILILLFALFFLKEKQVTEKNRTLELGQVIRFVRQRSYLQKGLLLGFFNAPLFVLGALWGTYYLKHSTDMSVVSMGFDSGLIFLGIILGSPCWGWLADKFNISLMLIRVCSLAALLLSVLFLFQSLPPIELAWMFFGLGFLTSSQNLIYPFLGRSKDVALSAVTGFVCLLANLVGAILQWFYGYIIHALKFLNLHSLTFLFFFIIFSICLGLTSNLKQEIVSKKECLGNDSELKDQYT